MIHICPLIAETLEGQEDIKAIIADDNFLGFFYQLSDGQFVKFEQGFQIAGFRTQEAKEMWINKFLPFVKHDAFDPVI